MTDRKLPKPDWIRAYLNAHGWTEEKPLPPAGVMYSLTDIPGASGPVTVFVPSLEESPDYPLRVAEAVTTIAGVEDRPEGRIWADLSAPKNRSAAIAQIAPPRQTRSSSRSKSRPSTKATDPETAPLARQTLTIVFWEICEFLRLTDQLIDSPAILTEFLAAYSELAHNVIQNNHGILHHISGDGVMALFGHPSKGLSADDGAESAVQAALEFSDKFDRLAAEWLSRLEERTPNDLGRPRLSCGIDTSEVLVGSVGKDQSEFTVIGYGVILAARVLDKSHEVPIRVTERVCNRVTRIPGWADRYVLKKVLYVTWEIVGRHILYSVERPMSG
jgi:class 3 adenylate cyclase